MTIGITGATGQLGGLVVADLLQHVPAEDLVLLSRSPEKLADLAPQVPESQRRVGDFADPAALEVSLAGVDTLLLISTDVVGPERRQLQRNAVEAAKAAGVSHVVYTSVPRPDPANPATAGADHLDTEQAIRDSGLTWTFLRNNLYADLQAPTLQHAAATGQLVTNVGDGLTAYVTRADCAAVAAAVLRGTGHENQAYDVTGPEAVSAQQLAALAGPEVQVVDVDDAAYSAGLLQAGLPEGLVEVLTTFGTATREGWLEDVSTVVADLTGRAPQSVADVAGA